MRFIVLPVIFIQSTKFINIIIKQFMLNNVKKLTVPILVLTGFRIYKEINLILYWCFPNNCQFTLRIIGVKMKISQNAQFLICLRR